MPGAKIVETQDKHQKTPGNMQQCPTQSSPVQSNPSPLVLFFLMNMRLFTTTFPKAPAYAGVSLDLYHFHLHLRTLKRGLAHDLLEDLQRQSRLIVGYFVPCAEDT